MTVRNRRLSLPWLLVALFSMAPRESIAARIASRGTMTCAIRADNAAVCWGTFASDRRTPPLAPTVRVRDAASVVVGLTRACAVGADATVRCWGPSGEARVIDGLAGVRELAGGAGPLCARMGDGSVRCADSTSESLTFAPVPGLANVEQLAVGQSHACARLRDGSVRCWGSGTQNQLGEGRYDSRANPVVARLLGRVTDLAAGDDFTCGRASDGRVRCVGYRFDATGSPRLRAAWTPTVLPRADALFAGAQMVCSVAAGRGVSCAGFDDVMAMGPGEYAIRFADGQAPLADVEEVAIGARSLCARTTRGAVRCIGDDAGLALGGATGPAIRSATRVQAIRDATRLVATGNHSCAIVANGEVKCWGFDDPQDLFATSGERTGPLGRRPSPVSLPTVTGATEVATTGATTFARLADGTLVLFGAGPFDPMGTANGEGSDRSVRIPPAAQRAGYAIGIQHLCGVTRAGAVECAGSGRFGQWGAGEAIPSLDGDGWFRRRFSAVNGVDSVTSLASAWDTLCATRSDGTLVCWGQNASLVVAAQGAGSATQTPTRRETNAGPIEQVTMGGIHGRVHACARVRGGAVRCWGANESWQTGSGGPRDRAESVVVSIAPAVSIAAGTHHVCAAINTGAVWCWGANDRGQCGSGASGAPRAVEGVTNAVEVAAGRSHSCARTRDGAVWCWGYGADGALGDGRSSYASAWVDVSL